MRFCKKQKGFTLLELLIIIGIILIFLSTDWDRKKPDQTMVQACVAEVQQNEPWKDAGVSALHDYAMSFTPPPDVNLNEEALHRIRKACFGRLVDLSVPGV